MDRGDGNRSLTIPEVRKLATEHKSTLARYSDNKLFALLARHPVFTVNRVEAKNADLSFFVSLLPQK